MGKPGFRSTCCYMGHPRTPENTREREKIVGGRPYLVRECLVCKRWREKRRRCLGG